MLRELSLDGRVELRDAVPRAAGAGPARRRTTRSSTTCAPALPTRSSTRLRQHACRCSPRTRSSTRCSPRRQRFERDDPDGLADRIRELAALAPSERAALGRRLRERVEARPLGRVLGAGRPRGCGDHVTGVVLHAQKVAGISGSEAHLLQLLPDLRERGWDVRFLMLHEDEPGAWEFAARARGTGRAPRGDQAPGRRRPARVRRSRDAPLDAPADDPPHAPRARGRVRTAGRER